MKKILIVVMLTLLSSRMVNAAEWLQVFASDTDQYFIDLSSIKKNNNGDVNAWFKRQIYNDTRKDGLTVGDYTLLLYQIDCNQSKYGIVSSQIYKNNKPLTNRGYVVKFVDMSPAIPETIGEGVVQRGCKAWEILNN
ncbi:TPA: hypothetical protein MW161_000534 [Acinetobacter baumannii]|nr:hypothetical protein [Acinetobacter baumannii]